MVAWLQCDHVTSPHHPYLERCINKGVSDKDEDYLIIFMRLFGKKRLVAWLQCDHATFPRPQNDHEFVGKKPPVTLRQTTSYITTNFTLGPGPELNKSGLSIESIAEQIGMTTDVVRCLVQCPAKSLGFSTEEIEKL